MSIADFVKFAGPMLEIDQIENTVIESIRLNPERLRLMEKWLEQDTELLFKVIKERDLYYYDLSLAEENIKILKKIYDQQHERSSSAVLDELEEWVNKNMYDVYYEEDGSESSVKNPDFFVELKEKLRSMREEVKDGRHII